MLNSSKARPKNSDRPSSRAKPITVGPAGEFMGSPRETRLAQRESPQKCHKARWDLSYTATAFVQCVQGARVCPKLFSLEYFLSRRRSSRSLPRCRAGGARRSCRSASMPAMATERSCCVNRKATQLGAVSRRLLDPQQRFLRLFPCRKSRRPVHPARSRRQWRSAVLYGESVESAEGRGAQSGRQTLGRARVARGSRCATRAASWSARSTASRT